MLLWLHIAVMVVVVIMIFLLCEPLVVVLSLRLIIYTFYTLTTYLQHICIIYTAQRRVSPYASYVNLHDPACSVSQEALVESFQLFQDWSAGPTRQCIHAPWRQTAPWRTQRTDQLKLWLWLCHVSQVVKMYSQNVFKCYESKSSNSKSDLSIPGMASLSDDFPGTIPDPGVSNQLRFTGCTSTPSVRASMSNLPMPSVA